MKFGYVTKFLIKIRPGLQEVRVLFLAKAAATSNATAPFLWIMTYMDYDIYRNFGSSRPSLIHSRYSAVAAKRTSPEEFRAVSRES